MSVIKLSGTLNMTYGLMVTYDAYVSLGRVEEFLLLENLLKASESDESNEPQQKTKMTLTNQGPVTWKKKRKIRRKFRRLVKQQK